MDKLKDYTSVLAKYHTTSRGELTVIEYLDKYNIPHLREVVFHNLDFVRFDFYLPKYKLAIEYDGRQHFEVVEEFGDTEETLKSRKKFDLIKNKFIFGSGGTLIRIRYDEDTIQTLVRKLKKYFPDNPELYD